MSSEKSSKDKFESAKDKLLQPDKHAEYRAKDQSKYFDPCQEAADRSIRCLHRNPTDKDLCSDYFQAYRNCKKAWLDQKKAGKWF